ncbi:MAG TPA: hypothetical protein VFH58_16020 [Acidimicrobiales bacterium]|nr:hypothetical protein [Acidimicrobiales bacterium]
MRSRMRLLLAALVGTAAVVACAVVLGDYPLSGSVPWLAALIIPLLIGGAMTLVAGAHRPALWMATGPLAAGSVAWGVRIATGWGLDPVPASCWAAIGLSLVWPTAWGLWRAGHPPAGGPAASVDGELGDLRHTGRTQVGDP